MCTAARRSVGAFACAPLMSRCTSQTIDAAFAALTIATITSESQCRVTCTWCVRQPRLLIRRPSGTVTRSAASRTAVSAGTTHRTTENAPADEPAMNRVGRSAYSTADTTIAADGQNGDSPRNSAPAANSRRFIPSDTNQAVGSRSGQAAKELDRLDECPLLCRAQGRLDRPREPALAAARSAGSVVAAVAGELDQDPAAVVGIGRRVTSPRL